MTLNLITVEDARAALLCELAAARLRLDEATMQRLTHELRQLGYLRPMATAELIARAAIDAERLARETK